MTFELRDILTSLEKSNEVALFLLSNWDSIAENKLSKDDAVNLISTPQIPSQSSSGKDNENGMAFWVDRDLRISLLRLSGYRGIPLPLNDVDYGISMRAAANDLVFDDPASIVLLGSNGSGKTSLYSAIELVCLGSTSIAEKHKIDSGGFEKFYHHLSRVGQPMSISLSFNDSSKVSISGKEELNQIKDHLDLGAFFCSESDISMFECSGGSVTDYLDDQIGLKELRFALKYIDDIIEKFTDSFPVILEENPSAEDSAESKMLKERYGDLGAIQSALNNRLEIVRNEILQDAQSILKRLLEDYVDDVVGISPVNNPNGTDLKTPFDGKLYIKADNRSIEPRDYLNNFRFKLYLISIRIAVAFHIMKRRKIAFPLMFDDVFDSSDFSNRLKTKDFFKRILDLYDEMKILNHPLQMIFFTQDEVIAESIYEGIRAAGKKNHQNAPAMFVRLFSVFPESEMKPGEKPIELHDEKFYNLYDEIRISV